MNLRDSVPSHNDEAEIATLGAILIDPEALPVVSKYLKPEHFYDPKHSLIYVVVIDLHDKLQPVDLITLSEELRVRGALENCGGVNYLSRLTSNVPTSANADYYARIVTAAFIRRRLAHIAQTIIAQSHDESTDVRVTLDDAIKRITELAERKGI